MVPLWLVVRPPSQDWAQHVAAVRVLIDHNVPALRLLEVVDIDLARTQYVGFYLVAGLLASVFGAAVSVKLLVSLALFSIPYSVRALLRAVGGDERLALFSLSLTYTAHVLLGFLNFVTAVPVAIFAIYHAVRYRTQPSLARAGALCLILLLLFHLHVVLYVFALIGVAFALFGGSRRAILSALLAVAPSLGLMVYWAAVSPAGGSTMDAVLGALRHESAGETRFDPFEKTLREFPEWVTDVLPGQLDVALLLGATITLLIGGLALRMRSPGRPWSVRLLATLPFIALASAFLLPYQHAWIWPIAGRFPYLGLLFLPLLFPMMRPRSGDIVAGVLAVLGLAHIGAMSFAFRSVEQTEMRGFEGALAQIPTGARVLGLIYDNKSQYLEQHVFMHFQAHAQAEHGGVCMFSFAEAPQSPFTYRPPPEGPPPLNTGMGWAPSNVDMGLASTYFEYAIARGFHPHLGAVERFYEVIFEENRWSVYRRRTR
ncbi:MAG: hypothetical protein JWN48_5489 [Myxococcaceae bacterium]|nr:hypothetical protein [Myxococcaceae bacterium]